MNHMRNVLARDIRSAAAPAGLAATATKKKKIIELNALLHARDERLAQELKDDLSLQSLLKQEAELLEAQAKRNLEVFAVVATLADLEKQNEQMQKQATRNLECLAKVATIQKVVQKMQEQRLERQVEFSQLLHQINALQDEMHATFCADTCDALSKNSETLE